MGNTHSKSAALGLTKHLAKALELLGTSYNRRIVLMYYLNLEKFLNQPDADRKSCLSKQQNHTT